MGTFLSIIITLVISLCIARWQSKRTRIAHYIINAYDIGKGLSNEFPEFELHYSGEKLSNKVCVTKGGFVQLGRNDLEKPVFDMILPKGFIIKAFKITFTTGGLKVFPKINEEKPNIVRFSFENLFMSEEFFEYSAIVELPEDSRNRINEVFFFDHRIKNTAKIKNSDIRPYESESNYRSRLNVMLLVYGIPILVGLFLLFSFRPVHFNIIEKETDKKVQVCVNKSSELIVSKPSNLLYWRGERISKEDFDNNYDIVPRLNFNGKKYLMIISLVVSLGLLIMLYYMINFSTNSRIHTIVRKKDCKQTIE